MGGNDLIEQFDGRGAAAGALLRGDDGAVGTADGEEHHGRESGVDDLLSGA